jgi:hypothetical protein
VPLLIRPAALSILHYAIQSIGQQDLIARLKKIRITGKHLHLGNWKNICPTLFLFGYFDSNDEGT